MVRRGARQAARSQRALCLSVILGLGALACEPARRVEGDTAAGPASVERAAQLPVEPVADSGEPGADAGNGESAAADSPDSTNDVEALVAAAACIEAVDLVDPDSQRRRGRLSAEQIEQIGRALAHADVRSDLVATPPPFPVVLRIHVAGRDQPFIAHFVGQDRLRLNPEDPWSDGVVGPAKDIVVGSAVYETLERILGGELRKEYRLPDNVPKPGGY